MLLKQELEERGFVYQLTDESMFDLYQRGGQTLYFGMDPTADSLHLGNLINFMSAINFILAGNKLIIIIGGATGMIGDPGGKDSERSFLDSQLLAHNVQAIKNQVSLLLSNLEDIVGRDLHSQVNIMDNSIFYEGVSYIDFLRDIGKHITVNSMMTRETIKKRLTEHGKSISYTEFSYMLMQGYDFFKLYQQHGVRLQIAGSDQWGNITMGTELIRKLSDESVYGLTAPLILASNGKKFGKSEGNALWLDSKKTNVSDMYNYFFNASDEDLPRYLKLLTLYSLDEIHRLVQEHMLNPQMRTGQKKLAEGIMQILYGTHTTQQQMMLATYTTRDPKECHDCIDRGLYPSVINISTSNLIDIIVALGLETSRGGAKKTISGGGISLNGIKVTDPSFVLTDEDWYQSVAVLRKGKQFPRFVKFVDPVSSD